MVGKEKGLEHDNKQPSYSGLDPDKCYEEGGRVVIKDEVFGEIHDGGPNFRGVSLHLSGLG